jgi:hypothetical protein
MLLSIWCNELFDAEMEKVYTPPKDLKMRRWMLRRNINHINKSYRRHTERFNV